MRGSFESSITHMEKCVKELNSSHKTMLKRFNKLIEEFRAPIDVIKVEMFEINT